MFIKHENAKVDLPTVKITEIMRPLLKAHGPQELERAKIAITLANLSDEKMEFAIDGSIIKFFADKMAKTLIGEESTYAYSRKLSNLIL